MLSLTRRNVLQAAAASATTVLAGCGGGSAAQGKGGSSSATEPPTPDFTATRTSGPAPIVTNFVDGSSGSISSWAWEFGDGATSALQNPTHTYAAPGAYSVKLTVTGPGGANTKTRAQYVMVAAPSATQLTISGPRSGSVGRASELFVVSTDMPLQRNIVVTPSDGGGGGTFTPPSITLTPTAGTASFNYKAASEGAKLIVLGNDGGLADPAALDFTAIVVTWPSKIAIGTWSALPTGNTLEDLNPDKDPLVNPNYPSEAPWRLTGGSHGKLIENWCGAVFSPELSRMLFVNGGGHGDGIPAASYDLQLSREVPRYTRMCTPSGAVGRPPLDYTAEFARGTFQLDMTGRHRAQHTLSFQVYWPDVGIVTLTGILLANTGGGAINSRPYVSDINTGELVGVLGAPLTTNQMGNGSFAAACYDPKRNVAWHKGAGYDSEFVKWGGPNNDAWTSPRGAPAYNLYGGLSMAYCPPLDLILVGNGDNSGTGLGPLNQTIDGGFGVFDPATGILYAKGVTDTFPTFTGAPALKGEWSTGLCPGLCLPQWAPKLGAFLAWDNSAGQTTEIMRITPPPSGDPRTGPWRVDYLPVSSSNAIVPSAAHFNGTYGRFFVWDDAGICGVVNNVTEAGFFFRYA